MHGKNNKLAFSLQEIIVYSFHLFSSNPAYVYPKIIIPEVTMSLNKRYTTQKQTKTLTQFICQMSKSVVTRFNIMLIKRVMLCGDIILEPGHNDNREGEIQISETLKLLNTRRKMPAEDKLGSFREERREGGRTNTPTKRKQNENCCI